MPNINIAVINASTIVSDQDVEKAVAALQVQVSRDFAPAWGIDATLRAVPKGKKPKKGEWWLTILDDADSAGALGYHDLTKAGLPMGKVFAKTSMQSHASWTVTASHELLELLADPNINLTVFEESDHGGRLYSYEVCDACEGDDFAYKIDGVPVSDFVYPAWFESFRGKGSARFDHAKKIDAPFQLLKGGYIGIYDVHGGGRWTQLTAEKGNFRARAQVGSRRERRTVPMSERIKSTAH